MTADAWTRPQGRIDALIVAAGRGTRVGGDPPKQYRSLRGRPLVRWAAEAFARHPRVGRLVMVVAPGEGDAAGTALAGLDVRIVDRGGATRQESVAAGLEAMVGDPPQAVLIHDGARPLPGSGLIGRVADALRSAPGAVPALPLFDTLKQVDGAGQVERTVPRAGLHHVQTPQGFWFDVILAAHRAAAGGPPATDDAALLEGSGHAVQAVAGDPSNLKVTGPQDFGKAVRLLGERISRTGQGIDVHRFGPGAGIRLLGVDVPHDRAVVGHSDADVGLHAVTDAILGALGRGDIGEHFAPGDPRWRGADSAQFVSYANELVREAAAQVMHVDVTVICEAPAVAPHRDRMRETLAGLLGVPSATVSVKATTTDGLGFLGRREGIAAFALATLAMPPESA